MNRFLISFSKCVCNYSWQMEWHALVGIFIYTLLKSLPAVLEAPKHWTWHQMIADGYLAWEAGCGTRHTVAIGYELIHPQAYYINCTLGGALSMHSFKKVLQLAH